MRHHLYFSLPLFTICTDVAIFNTKDFFKEFTTGLYILSFFIGNNCMFVHHLITEHTQNQDKFFAFDRKITMVLPTVIVEVLLFTMAVLLLAFHV